MKRITKKGFTLIELLVVIVLLAILVGVVIANYSLWKERGALAEVYAISAELNREEAARMVFRSSYTPNFSDLQLELDPGFLTAPNTYQMRHFIVTLSLVGNTYRVSFLRSDRYTGNFSNKYGQYTLFYDYPGDYQLINCAAGANCELDLLDRP
jgi:prepilin-type N-terminal cleavage/methylation domain-containing protein